MVAVGILQRAGHVAVVASNGRQVLDALDKERFDLILMDVQMPELDGLEATAAIRQRERLSGEHIPILALTAHATKGDLERCLEAGMDAYVVKPLQPGALLAMIADFAGAGPRARAVSPPVPRPPAPGVVDEARLLERVGGDRRALAKLARLFLADSETLLAEIHAAVERRDAHAIRAAAHTLKGAVANFAAPDATEAAVRLQRIGDSGALAGAQSALTRLEGEIERVRGALSVLVSKTPPRRPSPAPRTKARGGVSR
jgi:CheY-like chemotaxis protein/HPt (histidine-containing phosphotransfer) domain-containing protein